MPMAARIGASISETLSPTPPVECLSTTGPSRNDQSRTSPESRMARVSATRSSRLMSLKYTAIAKAAAWAGLTDPSAKPAMKSAMSCRSSALPSRFLAMISCGSLGAIRNPDVLDLRCAREEVIALHNRPVGPVISEAARGPALLDIARRGPLDHGRSLAGTGEPDAIHPIVLRQHSRQRHRVAGDDIDHASRHIRGFKHLIEI